MWMFLLKQVSDGSSTLLFKTNVFLHKAPRLLIATGRTSVQVGRILGVFNRNFDGGAVPAHVGERLLAGFLDLASSLDDDLHGLWVSAAHLRLGGHQVGQQLTVLRVVEVQSHGTVGQRSARSTAAKQNVECTRRERNTDTTRELCSSCRARFSFTDTLTSHVHKLLTESTGGNAKESQLHIHTNKSDDLLAKNFSINSEYSLRSAK